MSVHVYISVYIYICKILCDHKLISIYTSDMKMKDERFWKKKQQLGNVFSYLLYNCCFLYLLPGLPKFISLTFISPNVLR